MKILNEMGIISERTSQDKLNIQKIKEQKVSNQILNDNCTRNKKIDYAKKNIDEKKRIEIYPIVSFQTIISILKIIFNDLKIDLINTENLREQRYWKIYELKENQKQKRKHIIIKNYIAFRI